MRLDAPPDASLVLMREYLATYASLTMATHTYRIDESLQYPHEAKRADVNGTQTIRMHVDANGKVTRVETIASQLTPTTIARVDGTTIASRDLFEREVAAYMQVAGYPPRVKNGKPVATVFELPIVWQLEK
ncbi:MAG: energy transducer TonB [Burkholderiaceae bacterium]